MKKILLILIVFLNACLVQAQQGQTFGSTAKVMSAEEANRLNGTPQTTINGKPYSQYKAEQDALLSQQKAAMANQNKTVIPVGTTNPPVQQGNAVKGNTDPYREQLIVAPAVTPTTATTATTVRASKTVVTQTEVVSPATQTIQVGSIRNGIVTPPPVQPVISTSRETNSTVNTTAATSYSMPAVNIATGADASQQVKTTPVVATQQVQGQPKPAEVVVTPPSVINEPKKAPVKE